MSHHSVAFLEAGRQIILGSGTMQKVEGKKVNVPSNCLSLSLSLLPFKIFFSMIGVCTKYVLRLERIGVFVFCFL